jgi:putative copper export protein
VQAEPLINWSEPVLNLVDFIGLFLTAGAVGFRYSSLRGRVSDSSAAVPRTGSPDDVASDATLYRTAARRAAVFGLAGAVIVLARVIQDLPSTAQRAHTTTSALLSSNFSAQALIGCAVLALIGFLLASGRIRAGWPVAAIGVIVGTLNGALSARWAQLVNPMHELAAGLWIGSLFIMLVVGLSLVLRSETPADRRGPIAADMVNAFSPMALVCGLLVVVFGVITALKHLNPLSSLWTTPYGWALIAKLVVVAVVFGLGAWNWRRGRPALGSEAGAYGLRRSATGEVVAAGVVLLITAILVSLPSPRRPGAGPGGPGGPGGPEGGPPPAAAGVTGGAPASAP